MNEQLAAASRRDTPDTPALLIRLLGGFTITVGERPIPEDAWRGQKVRALLKLLALAPAQRLARDQLLDMLWPDFTPDAAASNLYSTLTVARKILAGVATLRLRAGMVAFYAPAGGDARAWLARSGGLSGGARLVWRRAPARRSLRGLGRRAA